MIFYQTNMLALIISKASSTHWKTLSRYLCDFIPEFGGKPRWKSLLADICVSRSSRYSLQPTIGFRPSPPPPPFGMSPSVVIFTKQKSLKPAPHLSVSTPVILTARTMKVEIFGHSGTVQWEVCFVLDGDFCECVHHNISLSRPQKPDPYLRKRPSTYDVRTRRRRFLKSTRHSGFTKWANQLTCYT